MHIRRKNEYKRKIGFVLDRHHDIITTAPSCALNDVAFAPCALLCHCKTL